MLEHRAAHGGREGERIVRHRLTQPRGAMRRRDQLARRTGGRLRVAARQPGGAAARLPRSSRSPRRPDRGAELDLVFAHHRRRPGRGHFDRDFVGLEAGDRLVGLHRPRPASSSHSPTVASVTDSPSVGTLTSMVIGSGLLAACRFLRAGSETVGPRAGAAPSSAHQRASCCGLVARGEAGGGRGGGVAAWRRTRVPCLAALGQRFLDAGFRRRTRRRCSAPLPGTRPPLRGWSCARGGSPAVRRGTGRAARSARSTTSSSPFRVARFDQVVGDLARCTARAGVTLSSGIVDLRSVRMRLKWLATR